MLRNRNFIILIIGQIISLFGSAIQRFSMSLYLLEFTGSAAAFSRILAISTIPYVICAPIAGSMADKLDRKKVMVWLDFISSAFIGLYSIVLFTGNDSQWFVGITMFLLSVTYTLYAPTVSATLPEIVSESELTSANGIVSQVGSIANFLGPVLAGILYSVVGIKAIVVFNGISFFLSAVMELFLRLPFHKKEKFRFSFRQSVAEMVETYHYVKTSKPMVYATIASFGMSNLSFSPAFTIVTPFVINLWLGLPSYVYGGIEAVVVLGMILGGFIITVCPKWFTMKRLPHVLFPMFPSFFAMAMVILLGKSAKFPIILVFALAGFVVFLSLGISNVISFAYIQSTIPRERLGKVSAFSTAIATISVAPGQMLYGQMIEWNVPLTVILLITASCNLLVTAFLYRRIKKLL